MTQDMEKEPIPQMGSDEMIPRHVYDKLFTLKFPDKSERKSESQPDRKAGANLLSDGSKIRKGIGAGVFVMDQGGSLALALGSTRRYSRQKNMPLRHAQLRI
jgi:hypothetical protein